MADLTGAFEVDGFVKQRKELEQLLMSNPAMEKKVQGIIRKVLIVVRKAMTDEARQAMNEDPRQARKAVKMMVYKRILGGSVSILSKRKAGAPGSYQKPRKGLPKRGGNRRTRSLRTIKLESYQGADRGFILRFLNAGTPGGRAIPFEYDESRKVDKWNKHPNTGNRGKIAAHNWFGNRSHQEMQNAAANLQQMIDDLIKRELG